MMRYTAWTLACVGGLPAVIEPDGPPRQLPSRDRVASWGINHALV